MNLFFWRRRKPKSHHNKSSISGESAPRTTQRDVWRDAPPKTTQRDTIKASSRHSALTREEKKKLKRLQQDGIIILIDQPNLERGMRKRMREKRKDDKYWALSYGLLREIIAKRGHMAKKPRKVLATYIMTSKRHQRKRCHRPSSEYLEHYDITVMRSPNERPWKRKETAVDPMIIRIMTQEFEGIEILRLNGITPPKRTFCLVAGDLDCLDVVQKARECGCDVEIWIWEQLKDMERLWCEQYDTCESQRCGRFAIKKLGRFRDELSRDWRDNSGAWSEHPYDSD